MSYEEEKRNLEKLIDTYECLVIANIPADVVGHQMDLLSILKEDEMIADWKISEDGNGGFDIAIFGWGEPRLEEDDDE